MAKENREIKSSVFADLFGDDEKDGKKNFLALYNAIHDTNLEIDKTEIEHKKIPQSVTKTFDNDVSMLINGKLIVLIEHQSTLNQNMPLRFLEYYVSLLNTIIPERARYKEVLYKIPSPEFYVFYNGTRKANSEHIMTLSNAFIEGQNEPMCEVRVKFINIGGKEGENLPVVQKCDILKQYCKFMEIVSRYKAELKNQTTDVKTSNWYDEAINEAISRNILADYLRRNGTEVRNMLKAEYDYDLDMQVKAEEAREKKAVEDAENLLKENIAPEVISRCTGLPLEEVLELQKSIPVEA